MADVYFDPWGEVAHQAADPDITGASEAELEAALAVLFVLLARDANDAKQHDRKGWFADWAGDAKCVALGHTKEPDADSDDDMTWWDEETHSMSWDGDWLCDETRHGVACAGCESGDCEARRLDVHLWALPGVTGGDRG